MDGFSNRESFKEFELRSLRAPSRRCQMSRSRHSSIRIDRLGTRRPPELSPFRSGTLRFRFFIRSQNGDLGVYGYRNGICSRNICLLRVSLELWRAVGTKHWREYFTKVRETLDSNPLHDVYLLLFVLYSCILQLDHFDSGFGLDGEDCQLSCLNLKSPRRIETVSQGW